MSEPTESGRGAKGARAKVAWGAKHLGALHDQIVSSFEELGTAIAAEPDTGSRYVLKLKINQLPLETWALMLGDAIHSLRGALDHVAWEAASRGKGLPGDEREQTRIQFPIYDTEKAFNNAPILKFVSDEGRAIFKTAQTYDRPDRKRPLKILAALSNDDKHRLLLPGIISMAPGKGGLWTRHNQDVRSMGKPVVTVKAFQRLEQDAEFGYIPDVVACGPNPHVQVQGDFPAFVAFEGRGGIEVRVNELATVAKFVDEIIQAFDALFKGEGDQPDASASTEMG
jgi:hypothetical protein